VVPTSSVPKEHAEALDEAIRNNVDAVLGGADFPDFLYACGTYSDHHDAGEIAHWPTFHAAAVAYVRETAHFDNVSTWSDATKRLVAFIFGTTVHYVTDELWEGLTSELVAQRGFVELVDAYNLGLPAGSDVNEGATNMAGDFYVSWILNESTIDPWTRTFPIDDIVEIYHRTPKSNRSQGNFSDVTASSLVECEVLFDLGLFFF
jgi:hypothetical protein